MTKAFEKETEIIEIIIFIGSLSEAWRALTRIAAETQEAAYDRVKGDFESLEIGVCEPVAEYFARVHVVLMKLTINRVTTPTRQKQRRVLSGLTPRFPDDARLYAIRRYFELSDLEAGSAPTESFQSDQERRNASVHALAVVHAGGGQTRAGGRARDRGRHGRRSTKRHDDGRGRNQQKEHPQQMHPGQQQRPQHHQQQPP